MDPVLRYKFDEFEADLKAAELRKNGTRLRLQLQPFQVLVALLERPGDIVTREELRLRLWPQDTFVDFDHSLNTAMAKLRDVLGDSASKPKYIETIAKRGYRFLGNVSPLLEQPRTIGAPRTSTETVSPHIAGEKPESELPRASRRTARILFTLSQIMYLIFYLCALLNLDQLYKAAFRAWQRAGPTMFVVYLVTALVGMVVRLYLITATAFDYHLLAEKYRILFPILFLLDMLWALSPFLIEDRIGLGLVLGATAALLYMPFAQRVLMRMMARGDGLS